MVCLLQHADLIVTFKAPMCRQKIVYFLMILLAVSGVASAQNYTIKGKIFNAESKEPLPFVPVIIKGTTIGAQTDFDGNFVIKTPKLGDSLIATYVGYKRLARKINKSFLRKGTDIQE